MLPLNSLSLASWALNLASDSDIRLPGNFIPTNYDLALKTDLIGKHFWGVEEISLQTVHPSDRITLHAGSNLNIDLAIVCRDDCHNVTLERRAGSILEIPVPFNVKEEEELSLILRWDAEIDGKTTGYILSPDVGFDTPGVSAVTRFEPIDARTVFPCFDQPEPKASVRMRMISRPGTTNLANMDVEIESLETDSLTALLGSMDGWQETRFHKSPKMSMYNVAWGNGRFNSLTNDRRTTVQTTVWANYADMSGFHHLLETIQRSAAAYSDLFDLPFPLPKLDWMATPAFGGGIEHWGLVTSGSEEAIWRGNSSDARRMAITSFASHEIAHQWFGDAVTMKWWDDTWLNEAFASYAADAVVAPMLDPAFDVWQPWSDRDIEGAIHVDATESHPIMLPINSEDDLSTAFDQITYQKGASVLRMFANVVGAKQFLKGVGSYLRRYAYGNTIGQQLWDEMDHFVSLPGMSMGDLARPWVEQAGFPVIHVEHLGGRYRLTQERYFSIPSQSDSIWPIPLFAEGVPLIMAEKSIEVTHTHPLVLNRGRLGFYRTRYDDATFNAIKDAFIRKDSILSGTDRATFLYDTTAFAQSGHAHTTSALDLLRLQEESDASVWTASVAFISRLRQLFWNDQPMQAALQDFGRQLVEPLWESLNGDDIVTNKFRQVLLPLVEISDLPSFIQDARRYLDEPYEASEELASALSRTAVRHGGTRAWEKVHAMWKQDQISNEGQRMLSALTAATDPTLVDRNIRVLESLKGTQRFRQAMDLLRQPTAHGKTFDWLMAHVDEFYGETLGLLAHRVIADTLSTATNRRDRDRIQRAFHGREEYQPHLKTAYEAIDVSIAWLKRDRQEIRHWFGIV